MEVESDDGFGVTDLCFDNDSVGTESDSELEAVKIPQGHFTFACHPAMKLDAQGPTSILGLMKCLRRTRQQRQRSPSAFYGVRNEPAIQQIKCGRGTMTGQSFESPGRCTAALAISLHTVTIRATLKSCLPL